MSAAAATDEKVFFLYGSESGNCESIAKRLHHEAVTERGYPAAECMTLNQAVTKKVLDKQVAPQNTGEEASTTAKVCLVIVCSTTGEGEPPENASRFRRWLRNTTVQLVDTRYTVLALGDTNYNNFCAAGKFLDSKLNEHGGVRFYPRGEADDGVGLELVVDPWIEGLWGALAPPAEGGAHAPVDHATFQSAELQRVDMAVALETAILYANGSQICATLALFMYERIAELGGRADMYPIQYFCPEKLKREAKVLLFVLCTDSDEHTLCEHCACAPRQPPLGPFAELLSPQLPSRVLASSPADVSPVGAALRQWMSDASVRFYSAVCVAPKQESVGQCNLLAGKLRDVAAACKLDRLSKRQSVQEATTVAVSEDDVFSWAETVLDNLPGVTASTETIHASLEWFFDARVGAAFRDAYAADIGLFSAVNSPSQLTRHSNDHAHSTSAHQSAHGGMSATFEASPLDVIAGSFDPSASASPSAGSPNPSETAVARLQRQQKARQRLHQRLHHELLPSGHASKAEAGAGDDDASANTSEVNNHPSGLPVAGGARGGTQKDSKLLNEYLLTPVVLFYSGSPFISQIAHEMNAEAGTHHLRSSVADLSNFGHSGFPRRATFIFVVTGEMTKPMSKLFRLLRTMCAEKRKIGGFKFAILGVDESSRNEKFNVCALELETLLLTLEADKIHCTGLADVDSAAGPQPVIQSWVTNLWAAVLNPTRSVAYLDAASVAVYTGSPLQNGSGAEQSDALVTRAVSSALDGGSLDWQRANSAVAGGSSDRASPVAPGRPSPETSLAGNELVGGQSAKDVALRAGASSGPTGSPTGVLSGSSSFPVSAAVGPESASRSVKAPAPLFPWDSVPLNRDNAHSTPLVFLYSSSGMAKTMASHAVTAAKELGFPTHMLSFSHFDQVDFAASPNVVLFCESAPDGKSSGGKQFRRYLMNPSHPPDFFSHLRFAVLGLSASPQGVVHPAFTWARMLSRLEAARVFPVVIMPSLSQLHSLGIPWCECVFATLALSLPKETRVAKVANGEGEAPLGSARDAGRSDDAQSYPLAPAFSTTARQPMSVLFLYGSSTGLTESIARDLHADALGHGYASRIAALNHFERMNFVSTDNIVVVCSTVGTNRGGYPDNAKRFARYIHRSSLPRNLLDGSLTSFAVLGLDNGFGLSRDEPGAAVPSASGNEDAEVGGTRGGRFCRAAKHIDSRLERIGGRRLCAPGFVDATMCLAEPVEAWRRTLFNALGARAAALSAADDEHPVQGSETGVSAASEMTDAAQRIAETVAARSGAASATPAGVSVSARHLSPRFLVAYASPAHVATESIVANVQRAVQEATKVTVDVTPMSHLTEVDWRSAYRAVVFVVSSTEENESPPNGLAFFRLLRQRENPVDLFSSVRYTVLTVSSTRGDRLYLGRTLDQQLERLGATRFYARGEAVDSAKPELATERWISGLLSALGKLNEAATDAPAAQNTGTAVEGQEGALGGRNRQLSTCAASSIERLNAQNGTETAVDCAAEADEQSDTGAVAGEPNARSAVVDEYWQSRAQSEAASCTNGEPQTDAPCGPCKHCCEGVIHSWKLLTSSAAEQPVVLMNLSVCPDQTQWTPGQTAAVMPVNDTDTVNSILSLLHVTHDEPFHPLSVVGADASAYPTSPVYANVEFPMSCGAVLRRCVSLRLTAANKQVFSLLEKNLVREEDKAAVRQMLTQLSSSRIPLDLAALLSAFPDASLPFRHVVEHLSTLQPRVYSIASAAARNPRIMALCFRVVPHGLCTTWMYDLCQWAGTPASSPAATPAFAPNEWVAARRRAVLHFSLRPVTEFKMPKDPLVPLLLIGPGTGISPFRAFLQERAAYLKRLCDGVPQGPGQRTGAKEAFAEEHSVRDPRTPLSSEPHPHGQIDLYFGCRRSAEDFLLSDELHEYERDGVLHSLSVAFSREADSGAFWYGGCYVQDKLSENGVGIAEQLTQRGARVYVCGDADAMAKEVHSTLVDIIQQHLRLTNDGATEYINQLMQSGRYIRDVWTTSGPA